MAANRGLPFTTLFSVISTTVSLVITWVYLINLVKKKRGLPFADTLLHLYTQLVAYASLALGVFVLDIGHNLVSKQMDISVSPATLGYSYHILKMFELLEVLLLVASGEANIDKHTAFTRLFMPYWTYFRIINRPFESVDWRMQATVDCLGRFIVFIIPYVIDDVTTGGTILDMVEEVRYYPDLAIFAFWAIFTLKGERESDKALEIFGKPYEDETLARVIGLVIVVYASFLKRQANAQSDKKKDDKPTDHGKQKNPAKPVPKSQSQRHRI